MASTANPLHAGRDVHEFAWYGFAPVVILPLCTDIFVIKFLRTAWTAGAGTTEAGSSTTARTFKEFALDCSKQAAGLLGMHAANILLAVILRLLSKGEDLCSWYWLLLASESTLGVFLEQFCVLRWTTWWIRRQCGHQAAQEAFSGTYDGELAGESFDLVKGVKPELRKRYWRQLKAWLVVIGCSQVAAALLVLLVAGVLYPLAERLADLVRGSITFTIGITVTFLLQLWVQDNLLLLAREDGGNPAEARLDRGMLYIWERTSEFLDFAAKGFWLAETSEEAERRQDLQERAAKRAPEKAVDDAPSQPEQLKSAAVPLPEVAGPLERFLKQVDEFLNQSSQGVQRVAGTFWDALDEEGEVALAGEQPGDLAAADDGVGLRAPLLKKKPSRFLSQRNLDFLWKAFLPLAKRWRSSGRKLLVLLVVSLVGSLLLTAYARLVSGCHSLGRWGFSSDQVCPMIIPAFVYEASIFVWCLVSGTGWGVWGSGKEQFLAVAEAHAASWFWLFTPVRWLIGQLNRWTLLEYWPLMGSSLQTFAEMQGPPVSLPEFSVVAGAASPLTSQEASARTCFWMFVIFLKVGLLLFSTSFWHHIFIQWPLRQQKAGTPRRDQWSPVRLTRLFVIYHLCHNLFLFLLVQVAVVNGFVSLVSGLDWELWSLWVDWLIVMLNLTAIVKYSANKGTPIRQSQGDILMLLLPGFGNDIHLAKDWIFVGFCFQEAISATGLLSSFFAYFLALASIVSLFLPLPELLRDLRNAESFISSHWPIIMALVEAEKAQEQDESFQMSSDDWRDEVEGEVRKRAGIGLRSERVDLFSASGVRVDKGALESVGPPVFVHIRAAQRTVPTWSQWWGVFVTTKVSAQTTEAKQVVAEQNELPQAVLELLFLVAFGASWFIVFAALFSVWKVMLIPVGRRIVVHWIQRNGDANSLVSFVQEHGDVAEWSSGSHALHLAAGCGKLSDGALAHINPGLEKAIAPLLSINKVSSSINKRNKASMTPLLVAARFLGDPKVFMRVCLKLVEALADPVGFTDHSGKDALTVLKERGEEWQQASELLQELCTFHQAGLSSDLRRAPLLWAAETGNDRLFKLLADSNANMQSRGSGGRTPLHFAVKGGKREICTQLIVGNADILATDDAGRNPAHEAAIGNQSDTCSLLLSIAAQNGEDWVIKLLQASDGICKATPLHYAALATGADAARGILGGDSLGVGDRAMLLRTEDAEGKTPLHWVAGPCMGHQALNIDLQVSRKGAKDISLYLVLMQADPMAKDVRRKTPVDISQEGGGCGDVRHALLNLPRTTGGDPPLVASVKGYEAKMVKFLMANGVDINCQEPASPLDAQGWVALHHAADTGQPSMCAELIKGRAEVTKKTSTDLQNPLHLAAASGHAEACRVLLQERASQSWLGDWFSNDDLQVQNQKGRTPLELAAQAGHADACKEMAAALQARDQSKHCLALALWCTIRGGRREACNVLVQELLRRKGDVNSYLGQSVDVDTLCANDVLPLHFAVVRASESTNSKEDRPGICRLLVENRADITMKVEGKTPMDLADGEIKGRLVNEWSSSPGMPPLAVASAEGRLEVACLLLQHKADASARVPGRSNRTPLHFAAAAGHRQLCNELVTANGVDVKDGDQRTPLHLAAMENHVEVCTWLLAQGASRAELDSDDSTPLHLHFYNKQSDEQLCKLLVEGPEGSAALSKRDARGMTPLHYVVAAAKACTYDAAKRTAYTSICSICVKANLDAMGTPGREGRTPLSTSPDWLRPVFFEHSGIAGVTTLHVAVAAGKLDIGRLLIQEKAEVNRRADVNYLDISDPPPTAIEVACAVCNQKIFDELWAAGACLWPRALTLAENKAGRDGTVFQHIRDIMTPPLHRAAGGSDIEALRTLIDAIPVDRKGDFVFKEPVNGMTPLHIAAEAGVAENCKLLTYEFNYGPRHPHGTYVRWYLYSSPFTDLMQTTPRGDCPLHVAAEAGNRISCEEILGLEMPSDVKERLRCWQNNDGMIPLALATLEGHADVCRFLEMQHIKEAKAPDPGSVRVVIPQDRCGLQVKGGVITKFHQKFYSSGDTAAQKWNSHEKCGEDRRIRPGAKIVWCNTRSDPGEIDRQFQLSYVKTLIFDMVVAEEA